MQEVDILPLNEKFDQKMANVEFAIKHLTQLATLYHNLENRVGQKAHAQLVKTVQTDTDTVSFPFKYVPEPEYKGFFGRDDTFLRLSRHLDPNQFGETRSALMHGIGGVGKTKSALTWAHRAQFDAVFFVQAETEASLRSSFTKIAVALKLLGASLTADADQNFLFFQGWLGTQSSRGKEGRRWLIIFDNCENIEDLGKYLPTTAGSVLITSRHLTAKLDDSLSIELKPFEKNESIEFFKQLANWNRNEETRLKDEAVVPQLLSTVAGLPLGIKALASLMNARQKSAVEFLPFYSKHAKNLLKDAGRVADYDKDKSRIVGRDHILYKVFQFSFESLQEDSRIFIGIMSCISPEDIPLELFGGFENGNGSQLPESIEFCSDEYVLDKVVLELREHSSLITQQGSVISIHRIIQEAFIFYQPKAKVQEAFDAAVVLVCTAFPVQINGRPMYEDRARCETYIQHARALADFFDPKAHKLVSVELKAPKELGETLKSCAWHLYETGQLKAALSILDVAFRVCQDKESLLYAHLCNTASCCYFDLNDLARGRSYAKETLDIRLKSSTAASPEEEEDIANSYNNYGNLDCAAEDFEPAELNFKKCEEIRWRLGEGLIIPIGILHLNVGRMLCRQKKFEESVKRYQDAEEIFLKVLGTDVSKWPELASGVSMLFGTVEAEKGNLDSALKYFEHSRRILEKSAPFHISLASVCFKIACVKIGLENTKDVIEDLQSAYAIADFVGAEGEKARILRKQAQLLTSSRDESEKADGLRLKEAADCIRINLPGGMRHLFEDTDAGWNRLVCSFYR